MNRELLLEFSVGLNGLFLTLMLAPTWLHHTWYMGAALGSAYLAGAYGTRFFRYWLRS